MTYPTTPTGELTARERRALSLYAQGVPQKQIAELMHISRHTVVNHLDRCQQHLLLHNRLELKMYARMQGLDKVEQEATEAEIKREYQIALREGGYYACFPEKEAGA